MGFQFLMVRLKACRVFLYALSGQVISIPYGSIKRQFAIYNIIFTTISIPYGSIKSVITTQAVQWQSNFNSLWFD